MGVPVSRSCFTGALKSHVEVVSCFIYWWCVGHVWVVSQSCFPGVSVIGLGGVSRCFAHARALSRSCLRSLVVMFRGCLGHGSRCLGHWWCLGTSILVGHRLLQVCVCVNYVIAFQHSFLESCVRHSRCNKPMHHRTTHTQNMC